MSTNHELFTSQVFMKAPPDIPAGILREEVVSFQRAGRTARADVAACIMEAGRAFEETRSDQGGMGQGGAAPDRGTAGADPEVQAVAERVMESYQPEVEALRMELFGSPEPPFQFTENAAKWILEECRLGSEREKKRDLEEVMARLVELGRLQQELCIYMERPIEFKSRDYTLQFFSVQAIEATGQSDRRGGVVVQEQGLNLNSPLWTLKKFVMPIVSQTGFDEPRLVSWVLVGVPLTDLLPRVDVQTSLIATPGHLPKTSITIWKGRVSNKDLREDAFKAVKEFEFLPHPRLKELDLEIINILKEVGTLPERGKGIGEYWGGVATALKRRGHWDIKGPAVRRRCERLRKRGLGHFLPPWLQ